MQVSLVLFTAEDRAAGRVTAEIALDPLLNRTVRRSKLPAVFSLTLQ